MSGALRLTIFAALAALATPAAVFAHPDHALVGGAEAGPGEVTIAGVLDGRRDRVRLDGVSVSINGALAELGSDGHFAANVPVASHYRVDITGERIFDMVQTFGSAEIRGEDCDCLAIPAIELVARKPGRIELFFGGDSMAGRRFVDPRTGERALVRRASAGSDLDRLLAPIKPYIETSDLASINLETVLADVEPGPPLANKRITFFTPTEYAQALKRAGVDYVTLGNNHIYDFGEAGVASTIAALEAAGLAHSGGGHDEVEAERAARIDLPKNRLSLLGFVGWEGSGGAHQSATDAKGGAALGTRGQIRRSVRAVDKDGRIPILQYHGGAEYIDRPSATTIGRLREAVNHGAPLAIGHHPHLVQGVEVYRDALIAPSIGNFMFDQEFPRTQTSYVIKAWLEKGRFIRGEIIPIAVLDYRPVPAVGGARQASLRRLFALSAERGTQLVMSGGHAVVRPGKGGETAPCRLDGPSSVLADFVPLCEPAASSVLGREILARGDFELATAYGAWDRIFGAANAGLDFVSDDDSSYAVLRPERAGKALAFYTQGYLRDVPSGGYTISARLKLPAAARVEFLAKAKPESGSKPSARWRGELLGAVELPASDAWQRIELDFARLEEEAGMTRAFRPIVRIIWTDPAGTIQPVSIDDMSLVSWFRPGGGAQGKIAAAWRATHLRGTREHLAAQ